MKELFKHEEEKREVWKILAVPKSSTTSVKTLKQDVQPDKLQ